MSDMLIETEDGVTTIAFNRPEKKNAITEAMYGAVADALNAAAADDAIRAGSSRLEPASGTTPRSMNGMASAASSAT